MSPNSDCSARLLSKHVAINMNWMGGTRFRTMIAKAINIGKSYTDNTLCNSINIQKVTNKDVLHHEFQVCKLPIESPRSAGMQICTIKLKPDQSHEFIYQ